MLGLIAFLLFCILVVICRPLQLLLGGLFWLIVLLMLSQ
jgi:hypothetical protein